MNAPLATSPDTGTWIRGKKFSPSCRSGRAPFDYLVQAASRRAPVDRAGAKPGQAVEANLQRIVEPLVSYICASDQPRHVLASALSLLFDEMKATNNVAQAHFAAGRL